VPTRHVPYQGVRDRPSEICAQICAKTFRTCAGEPRQVVGDDLTMYRHVLGRWWGDAHRNGADHPMVDRRNSTRRQLNRLAHRLRQVNGEIGTEELVASGERRFSVGDRITARPPNRNRHPHDDRHAYVRNGALGTIVAIQPHQDDRQQDTWWAPLPDVRVADRAAAPSIEATTVTELWMATAAMGCDCRHGREAASRHGCESAGAPHTSSRSMYSGPSARA
jgi:hypothetical protein